ncbi:LD-carboxypeptidase, partial [Rubrivirga sp.]|uniref:LD-carboxypeptidase n=1 Tax=Rubrivirga sp. TaxID=1885344 RepID=UPI003C7224D3
MSLPAPITRSSRVAVVAPASAALDRSDMDAGIDALRARGLEVEVYEPGRLGYLAGPDADRARALNAA